MTNTPAYWQRACNALANDRVMAQLIDNYSGEPLHTHGDAFTTLVRAIVGQQISVRAAASVMQRLEQGLPTFTPSQLLAQGQETLRGYGLSRSKARYICAVATYCKDQPDWSKDPQLLRNELLALPGIGEWTWQMFAIFYLHLPDEFPLKDLGLRKALIRNYQLAEDADIGSPAMQQRIAGWQPWRTVATWYLWRSIDPHPVHY